MPVVHATTIQRDVAGDHQSRKEDQRARRELRGEMDGINYSKIDLHKTSTPPREKKEAAWLRSKSVGNTPSMPAFSKSLVHYWRQMLVRSGSCV
eukprot:1176737-Prorocentrum_minimum.AAC.1